MRCPFCHVDNDRVIDSRTCDDGFATRRRRECIHCNRRYTTYERLEPMEIKVVKKDGVREPFDASKLRDGISKACWKRPIRAEQIDSTITDIKNRIYAEFEKEIGSKDLGRIVMEEIRELDQVAYVRFASVYREFKDANDFVDEIRPMLDDPRRTIK